jgi:hypothetical protein
MRLHLFAAVAVAASAVGGCQTWGPTWSEVTGARYTRTTLYRLPSRIERVDDQAAFVTDPIKIEPGEHRIVLSGTLPGWPGANLETMNLDAKPCMRYYINNQYENLVNPGYKPVIDYVEQIAGCQVPATK